VLAPKLKKAILANLTPEQEALLPAEVLAALKK
jgi:hypothetical protein